MNYADEGEDVPGMSSPARFLLKFQKRDGRTKV
jgi:hypothetical protein